jgi:hypothetical protein
MAISRNRKPAGKAAKKTVRKAPATSRVVRKGTTKPAKAAKRAKAVVAKSAKAPVKAARTKPAALAKPAARHAVNISKASKPAKDAAPKTTAPAKSPTTRPASVKTAARAVAAARASAAKRRAPSYIPRSRFDDDWMLSSPVELPLGPRPAAHTPTRKPPKPRAPKPKAISHEQAVANLKALLESRKRKDRGGSAGASAAKGA